MTRDGASREFKLEIYYLTSSVDLFNTNASIVRDLAKAAAEAAPEAKVLVISNPVRGTILPLLYAYSDQICFILGQLDCPHLRRSLQG